MHEKDNAKEWPRSRSRLQGRNGGIQMKSKSVVVLEAKFDSTYELNSEKNDAPQTPRKIQMRIWRWKQQKKEWGYDPWFATLQR